MLKHFSPFIKTDSQLLIPNPPLISDIFTIALRQLEVKATSLSDYNLSYILNPLNCFSWFASFLKLKIFPLIISQSLYVPLSMGTFILSLGRYEYISHICYSPCSVIYKL